jgi:predicted transcriptional regulator
MEATYVRLPQPLKARVTELARKRGVSVSQVIRESVEHGLDADREHSRAELWVRAAQAVGCVTTGEPDLAAHHDEYLAEAFAT